MSSNIKKYKFKWLRIWKRILYFFPLQLLKAYFKHHQIYLLIWLFPFLIILNKFGVTLGMPSLFLAPEYNGNTGLMSFLFMGLVTGSFIMAFHISSYIVMSHRFPFIVTTRRPFLVYAQNNSSIPFVYILLYIYESINFQLYSEYISFDKSLINILFFLIGITFFIFFSFGFFYVIVRIFPLLHRKIKKRIEKSFLRRIFRKHTQKKEHKINNIYAGAYGPENIELYLKGFFNIGKAKKFNHYDKKILSEVLYGQHLNAFYYIVLIISFIIIRGQFKEVTSLILPAGASLLLIFTVITLGFSLLYIIFKKWTVIVLLSILLLLNHLFDSHNEIYNSAYGLNYNKQADINICNHGDFRKDSLSTIDVLNNWKIKNTNDSISKPKMVIVCTSGGGLKMALWTYYSLGYVDSLYNGQLLKQTELITGASGGMIGAAYIRELYLRHIRDNNKSYFKKTYFDQLSKNLLNPIMFSLSFSDWFIRFEKFNYNKHSYYVDRAFMFERTLNANTLGIFDKSILSYRQPEQKATIPMMILNPSIMNTGSRLIISPLNQSYLVKSPYLDSLKNIEFRYTYKRFEADSLRFLTALRMQSSFPYVSPPVYLPGHPTIRIFDAGLNDDYGYLTAYNFIMEFSDWINQNTSGVILINIGEQKQHKEMYYTKIGYVSRMFSPFRTLFGNLFDIQLNNNLQVLSSVKKVLNNKFYFIDLKLISKGKKISLSWELTNNEKQIIINSIHSEYNKNQIDKLDSLLN